MLIVEDDSRSKIDPRKMKPMEKLRLIESGREKAKGRGEKDKRLKIIEREKNK